MPGTMTEERKPKKPGRPKDPKSKRALGVDRHAQPRFAFHLEADLLGAIGDYCEAQRLKPDRSEVVRLAIREFLEREGYWPRKKGGQ